MISTGVANLSDVWETGGMKKPEFLELMRMAQPEQKPCALLFVHCVCELQGRAVDEPRGHPLHDHPPTQSGKNDMGTRCYLLQVYLRKAARQSGSTCQPWRRHGLRDERAEQAGLDTSLGWVCRRPMSIQVRWRQTHRGRLARLCDRRLLDIRIPFCRPGATHKSQPHIRERRRCGRSCGTCF